MTGSHQARLSRVYSSETWDLYDELDRSLDPRSPDWLHDRAGDFLTPGATVLDLGCRDAAHLIRLVERYGATGIGVEPVAVHVDRARAAVAAHGLEDRIRLVHGGMEDAREPAASVDLVWCRDVLEQVEPLAAVLTAAAEVLKPGGRLLVYTTVATDLLHPDERAMLARHLGNVPANLDERTLLDAYAAAGLAVESRDVIGTEWREYAEERTRPASTALLRLARLRRNRAGIVARRGEDVYRHVEANLHWEAFQLLGKLQPVVHLLRHRAP